MRIRMKVEMSGTRNGHPWPARGEVVDIPTGEAQHLVASGIAEEAPREREETAVPPSPEVSTPPAPEVASTPPAEKRGRGRPRLPRDAQGNIIRK